MKQTGKSKFYDFVPIAPLCKRNRGISYQTFNIQNYNGKLVLEIKVLSPLHIGTGKVILDKKMKEDTMKFVANSQGKIVPGSSLKGVVRTVAEAVSFRALTGGCPAPSSLPDWTRWKRATCFTSIY